MTASGHEGRFPLPWLSTGYAFSKETFAERTRTARSRR